MFSNADVTLDTVLKVIGRQPLWFQPGTMEAYSNSNFLFLGLVVEKASWITYEDYVEKRICEIHRP